MESRTTSTEHLRNQPASVRRMLRSFGFAGAGLAYLVRTQPNFRVHLVATVVVAAIALVVGSSATELAVLALAIGLVLVAEAFNSALEAVVDLASPRLHPLAKVAKDASATGVLLAAGIAALTGLLLLGPRLLALVGR